MKCAVYFETFEFYPRSVEFYRVLKTESSKIPFLNRTVKNTNKKLKMTSDYTDKLSKTSHKLPGKHGLSPEK